MIKYLSKQISGLNSFLRDNAALVVASILLVFVPNSVTELTSQLSRTLIGARFLLVIFLLLVVVYQLFDSLMSESVKEFNWVLLLFMLLYVSFVSAYVAEFSGQSADALIAGVGQTVGLIILAGYFITMILPFFLMIGAHQYFINRRHAVWKRYLFSIFVGISMAIILPIIIYVYREQFSIPVLPHISSLVVCGVGTVILMRPQKNTKKIRR